MGATLLFTRLIDRESDKVDEITYLPSEAELFNNFPETNHSSDFQSAIAPMPARKENFRLPVNSPSLTAYHVFVPGIIHPEHSPHRESSVDPLQISEKVALIHAGRNPYPHGTIHFDDSLARLTLPEALLYCEYFKGRLPQNSFCAFLGVKSFDPFVLNFSIQQGDIVTKSWEITYDPLQLSSEIRHNGRWLGDMHYILKKGKLVEISGYYEGQLMILGPVNLTVGHQTFEIVSGHLGSHDIAMDRLILYEQRHRLILTTKHVEIGPFSGCVKLIFCRNILTPITGQLAFYFHPVAGQRVNMIK